MCNCLTHFSQLPDRDDPQEFAFSPQLRQDAPQVPKGKQKPESEMTLVDYSIKYEGLEPLFKVFDRNPDLRQAVLDDLRKNGDM